MGCSLAIFTLKDFDCACEMNFLTKKKSKIKRAEEKRKEHLRKGAEEMKTKKRKKGEFFQETVGSTRVYIISRASA